MDTTQQRVGEASHDDFGEWLQSARRGDAKARGELLESFRRYLLLVAGSELDLRLQAKVAPSDLVQQTLLQAHRALDDFEGTSEAQWRGWLRQILVNEMQQVERAFRRTGRRDLAREVRLAQDDSSDRAAQLPSLDPSPSERASADEDATRLAAALARLPADYRQVIELRGSQWSFDQIGRAMNRSEAAARKLWARAVERLGEMLKE